MFTSFISLLIPICILFHKKYFLFHNNKTYIKNEITDANDTNMILYNNNKINTTNPYDGFDLKNSTTTTEHEEDILLQKIIINFRKLQQLQLLESSFITDIAKLKCAQDVLDEYLKQTKKDNVNNFWETYDYMFF